MSIKDREIGFEEIKDACKKSGSYLIFAAHLTPKKGKDGSSIIDFLYRRDHFSLEDSGQAVIALKEFVDAEVRKLLDSSVENSETNGAERD